LDLLTEDEARDPGRRADVDLMATRVCLALRWVADRSALAANPCGMYGGGADAAAMLHAAAAMPTRVRAVVSRGGRLDLAWSSLTRVTAPTLLVTGADVPWEVELHTAALRQLPREKRLEAIPGVDLRDPDDGVDSTVAALTVEWMGLYLHARDIV
jgi:hypothetical protein